MIAPISRWTGKITRFRLTTGSVGGVGELAMVNPVIQADDGAGQASWVAWRHAWEQALYGTGGFYRRPEGPAGHFRTASHAAGPALAAAIRRLADEHGCRTIVDVGAGRGELLTALATTPERATTARPATTPERTNTARPATTPERTNSPERAATERTTTPERTTAAERTAAERTIAERIVIPDPATAPEWAPGARLRLHGVDVVPRPPGLPEEIGWSEGLAGLPDEALDGALVIGWELLDVVPCPILELDAEGVPRVLLVEPATGRERLGDPATAEDLDWLRRWWPITDDAEEGDRVEIGAGRDEFWAALVARARAGGARALLAVDYAHLRATRPALGSLTGFRSGHAVPPRPDGTMDLTAHVAIDAVAAAGRAAGASSSELTEQHRALRALGVRDRELLDPGSLGGFSWLLQTLV
jgi:SAM-dependent MidA family methyltransferase